MTTSWRAPHRIETARLELRALAPEHVHAVHAVVPRNKAHLAGALPWVREEPLALESRRALLQQMYADFLAGIDFVFGIFEPATGEYVGGAGLHARTGGPEALEIGYWLAEEWQGKGFATEAATALALVALERMAARRVEIRCSTSNARSRAVAERLGFHLDGVMRDGGVGGNGELEDKMVWSLIAREFASHPLFQARRPKLYDVLGHRIAVRA